VLNIFRAHIYSKHIRPSQCVRCWQTFDSSEDLVQHSRETAQCTVLAEDKADGIDTNQIAQLRSKKRRDGVISEIDRWKYMYSIVFPNDTEIPSPCKPLGWFLNSIAFTVFISFHTDGTDYEPSESRNLTPGSEYSSEVEQFQANEYEQKLKQGIIDLVRKNKEQVGEQFMPQILEFIRDFNARNVQGGSPSTPCEAPASDNVPPVTQDYTSGFLNQQTSPGNRLQATYTLPGSSTDMRLLPAPAPQTPTYNQFKPFVRHTRDNSTGAGSSLDSHRHLSDASTSRRLTTSSMTNYSDMPAGSPFYQQITPSSRTMQQHLDLLNQNTNPMQYGLPSVDNTHVSQDEYAVPLPTQGPYFPGFWQGLPGTQSMMDLGSENATFPPQLSYPPPPLYSIGTIGTDWTSGFGSMPTMGPQIENNNSNNNNNNNNNANNQTSGDEPEILLRPRKKRHIGER
jgi:hypothetical protein